MTRSLRQLAEDRGLRTRAVADDELQASCPEAVFTELVAGLAGPAVLADLFATADDARRPRLTAVLQLHGDPQWLVLSTELQGTTFASLTPIVHAASWYEREIWEAHGLEPIGHPRPAPLRRHLSPGAPPLRSPSAPEFPAGADPRPAFGPAVEGQGLVQLPLGPVRSGPQESAAFLFSSGGEDLVQVSPRLGYKFRALERMAEGLPADRALVFAERLAGTSSFATALAFARAVERAAGIAVGPAAEWTRTCLAELERVRSHCAAVTRLADATGLLVASAQYGLLTEELLRTAADLTGHRYLRGCLSIGGADAIQPSVVPHHLRRRVDGWADRASALRALLDETSTFLDRLDTTAVLEPAYAERHQLVGPVGRASGADCDARRDHPYLAYPGLPIRVPVRRDGDAAARLQVRLDEIDASLGLLRRLLDVWIEAPGPMGPPELRAGAALGWAEAPGGETLAFVELDSDGRVRHWRARPPAVVNWHPYAHACASGNNLTDYPVIEASFDLSVAEFDR